MTVINSAIAQEFPDPRPRVEIKFDSKDRPNAARNIRVRDSQCRETISDPEKNGELRQRIVDLAAREWEAFHFPVLDIASEGLPFIPHIATGFGPKRSQPIIPEALNRVAMSRARMLRNGLLEDDSAVAARIGGYWATIPGNSAIDTQNVIWGKGGWPGAAWAQPWSAALIGWVMCEAGLLRTQFQRAPTHAQYIAGFFQNPDKSAYSPKLLTELPAIGDLLCATRDGEKNPTTLDEAEKAARDDTPMHCDIVVGILPERILLIGGNVRDAVTMTIIRRHPDGTIKSEAQRPWFAMMKLKAPANAKAGLAQTRWRCLGQNDRTQSCLNEL